MKGPSETKLFDALDKLGVDLQAYHSGTFVGNHMFKVLSVSDDCNGPQLLAASLSSRPEIQEKFYNYLIILGGIFKITSKAGFLNETDISNLKSKLRELQINIANNFQDNNYSKNAHAFEPCS